MEILQQQLWRVILVGELYNHDIPYLYDDFKI